ncbi:MAG TPA: sigma-70 family RNA polymerase sigma factor [Gemmataceae bacterium]|nr:sigma-70 family RNA polymerase sigma factor [Gemmataceae bacterium]
MPDTCSILSSVAQPRMSTCSTADVRQLAGQNLPLAYRVAGSFAHRARAVGLDDDDLKQEAVIGLMRGAAAFDPAGELPFAAIAYKAVRWYLLRVLETRRYRRLASLPLGDDGEEWAVEDQQGEAPDDRAEFDDERELLRRLLGMLKPQDKLAVEMYYLHDMTLHEIARATGVSHERVRQRLVRGLRQRREQAGQDGAEVPAGVGIASAAQAAD